MAVTVEQKERGNLPFLSLIGAITVGGVGLIVLGSLGLAGICSATAVHVSNIVSSLFGGVLSLVAGIGGLLGTFSITIGSIIAILNGTMLLLPALLFATGHC